MTDARTRLARYAGRRAFDETPEPAPGSRRGRRRAGRPRFVIQQHAARSLHWDFRLEVDGLLRSWAVPKGPSTDPRVRRLAVATEDHPLEYADFEGVIPAGHHGAGAVIVWDAGTYENLSRDEDGTPVEMARALAAGSAQFRLEGHKLRGGYALRHARLGGDERAWLLVKLVGEGADARRRPTSTEPRSVLSGRTVEELAAEAEGGEER